MSSFDNYLKGLLKQILDSFQILDDLKDRSGDLEIIKKEISKINGLITVLVNKLESSKNHSDDFVVLTSSGKYYLENYYFLDEIETLSKLYSNDSNRLKNLRLTILKALQEKKLIQKIEIVTENF